MWCWSQSFHCRTWRNFLFKFCSWKPLLLFLLLSASGSWVSDEPHASSWIGLYWHLPCPVLNTYSPLLHIESVILPLSGLIKELQRSPSFFACSHDSFWFLSKMSSPLLFLPLLAISVPAGCCKRPCTWYHCNSLAFLQAPMLVPVGRSFLRPGRKDFYGLPSLLAGEEWLLSWVLLERGTPASLMTVLSGYCLWHIFKWTPQWLQLWLKAVCSLPHWGFAV